MNRLFRNYIYFPVKLFIFIVYLWLIKLAIVIVDACQYIYRYVKKAKQATKDAKTKKAARKKDKI